ncbi:hypothetical protein L9F63_000562, partial [Diploptera punctata]
SALLTRDSHDENLAQCLVACFVCKGVTGSIPEKKHFASRLVSDHTRSSIVVSIISLMHKTDSFPATFRT